MSAQILHGHESWLHTSEMAVWDVSGDVLHRVVTLVRLVDEPLIAYVTACGARFKSTEAPVALSSGITGPLCSRGCWRHLVRDAVEVAS